MRTRFVDTSTTRLDLSEGDWIEVRNQIGAGAQKRNETAGLKRLQPNLGNTAQGLEVDFSEFSFARTASYVVEWSFRDAAGTVIPVTRAALEALDAETYREIEDALTAHIEAQKAKKTPTSAA